MDIPGVNIRTTGTLPDVAMRATTVRFGPTQWRLIRRQAEAEGVTTAQFIRDAAFARALIVWASRADPEMVARVSRLFAGNPSADDFARAVEGITSPDALAPANGAPEERNPS